MAFNVHLAGEFTPPVKAAEDYRNQQFKAVVFDANAVRLSQGDTGSGPSYILMSKSNSGAPCRLMGPGNIAKAYAGAAVAVGNWITVTASAWCIVGSAGSVSLIGTAVTAVASGGVFSLYIR